MLQLAAAGARPEGGPTDALLVASSLAGQTWATEALFRRHAPMACGLALRLLAHDADADDLVQDSFATALINLKSLQNPAAFAGWLRSIVVRTAYKRMRRRRLLNRLGLRRSEPVDTDALISPGAPPDVCARLRETYAAIEELPSDQRLVLLLRRVEGLQLEEIAKTTGMSLATVKRRLADAERKLGPEDT